jgi:hypothetical protein
VHPVHHCIADSASPSTASKMVTCASVHSSAELHVVLSLAAQQRCRCWMVIMHLIVVVRFLKTLVIQLWLFSHNRRDVIILPRAPPSDQGVQRDMYRSY